MAGTIGFTGMSTGQDMNLVIDALVAARRAGRITPYENWKYTWEDKIQLINEIDVKLAAFVGLITGFPLVIEALVLTILVGAAVSLILLITRVRSLRDPIPYGPFLVVGAAVTILWGYPIAEWFLH